MEVNCKCRETKNKGLLKPYPAHVDVQSCHHKTSTLLSAAHQGTGCLDEKGEYIEADKEGPESARGDANEFLIGEEEVDHTTECHVQEGINPYSNRRKQGEKI
ncbi:hypothetical protein F1880_008807 [Penicillium rolfsii]|nr:hypothetical protein F1880_008807 [Penicillium rolfsii]